MILLLLLILLTGIGLGRVAAATAYRIESACMAGGGGSELVSGDGIYTLSGTIGQAVAGVTGETHTEINAGFWWSGERPWLYLPLTVKGS
jgi:hypothetical protein